MTLGTVTQPKLDMTPEQVTNLQKLTMKLAELDIDVRFVPPIVTGPVISLYRFLPQGKTKVSHMEAVSEDISVVLGTEVVIRRRTGDSAVSISVPNRERKFVDFRDYVGTVARYLSQTPMAVPFAIGIDEFGAPLVEDLTQLPHVLIGGATNAGKSVLLKAIMGTIVYNMNSRAVRFYISDMKGLDYNFLEGVPHMPFKPAKNAFDSLELMQYLVDDSKKRLEILANADKDNIQQYNEGREVKMPYKVLVIDELADLMRQGGKQAASLLAQLVERSRAVGTHVVAATQRPSVDVLKGVIKANFPTRLSLRTASNVDSRVILDEPGAERLIMPGDMFYKSSLRQGMIRAHSPWAKKEDVKAAMDYAKSREEGQAR